MKPRRPTVSPALIRSQRDAGMKLCELRRYYKLDDATLKRMLASPVKAKRHKLNPAQELLAEGHPIAIVSKLFPELDLSLPAVPQISDAT